ncbi:MAG: sugar transferase [Nitrospirae bacterium]|nr:sugar transferase [Nitrospirota bacterium]
MINSKQIENYKEPFYKRSFDVLFSIIFIILSLPTFLLLAILVKVESPGPIFYGNLRIGLNGKTFKLYKFRTMRLNASVIKTSAVWKLRNDPRITRIGRLLRTTGLDEIPSLFNVLAGELSFVGPRPANPYEIEHYSSEQKLRLRIRPGLTGYWQVYGRENKLFDIEEMVKMDLKYAEKQSLWFDIKILWKTFSVGIHRRGAY